VFYLFVSVFAACLTFVFGRTVDIGTREYRQHHKYIETTVAGDLSVDDIKRADEQVGAFSVSFFGTSGYSLNAHASY